MSADNRREFLRKAGLGLLAMPLPAGIAAAQTVEAVKGEDTEWAQRLIKMAALRIRSGMARKSAAVFLTRRRRALKGGTEKKLSTIIHSVELRNSP